MDQLIKEYFNHGDAESPALDDQLLNSFPMDGWRRVSAGVIFGWLTAQAAALPDPHDLMSRSVKVTEANWVEGPSYSFVRSDVSSKHGSGVYEVLMIEGSPYLKVVSENGQRLWGQRELGENQKLAKEILKRTSESPPERLRRTEQYARERNRDHALLSELAEAFDYTLRGEIEKDGHEVWMLAGKPKAGYVPRSRESKVLSGMDVTFWIDKKTYQWLRVEAEVVKPVSIYGIAKVSPGTKFTLDQAPISGGLWMPKRFTMQVSASALGFIKEAFVQEQTYSDYERSAIAVAATRAGH